MSCYSGSTFLYKTYHSGSKIKIFSALFICVFKNILDDQKDNEPTSYDITDTINKIHTGKHQVVLPVYSLW